MKIAYLINCHKNIKHVARLAHRLHSENNHIYIHVDKKVSEEIYKSLFSYTSDLEYCFISEMRIDGKLDDRSLVDIVMHLISFAKNVAQQKSIHYSYYANMSGQDYPIKPMQYIHNKLKISYPAVFMLCRDSSQAACVSRKFNRNKALIRYRNWTLKRKITVVRKALQALGIIARKILKFFGKTAAQRIVKKGWNYYQGSAWWILSDIVIDSIEKEYNSPNEFSRIMIDESTTPEETYFQSLIMHNLLSEEHPLNNQEIKLLDFKTYVDFGNLSNRPIVHHPYILTINDYTSLLESDCWFARKFDDTIDSSIIDKIDKYLLE